MKNFWNFYNEQILQKTLLTKKQCKKWNILKIIKFSTSKTNSICTYLVFICNVVQKFNGSIFEFFFVFSKKKFLTLGQQHQQIMMRWTQFLSSDIRNLQQSPCWIDCASRVCIEKKVDKHYLQFVKLIYYFTKFL